MPQDKPWAHPDPPAAENWGFGGGKGGGDSDILREGRLRTNLFIIVLSIIVAIWVYRKYVKRDHNPFFYVPPTELQDPKVRQIREVHSHPVDRHVYLDYGVGKHVSLLTLNTSQPWSLLKPPPSFASNLVAKNAATQVFQVKN